MRNILRDILCLFAIGLARGVATGLFGHEWEGTITTVAVVTAFYVGQWRMHSIIWNDLTPRLNLLYKSLSLRNHT